MYIVVDKVTGEIVCKTMFYSENAAQLWVNRDVLSDNRKPVVVPLPSEWVLKRIAEGGSYSVIRDGGAFPISPFPISPIEEE